MFESTVETLRRQARGWGGGPDSRFPDVSDAAEEIRRHFRDNNPILLDGAPPLDSDSRRLLRQARESLARGRVDPAHLPTGLLRETLDAIQAVRRPTTRAGLVAVGPRRARVWWDADLLDDLDDVLAGLEKPRTVLRFFDVTGLDPEAGRWNGHFDLDVALMDQGKSVDFWAADRAYVVELGMVHADGRFTCLARTNIADLPRECRGRADAPGTAHSSLRARPRKTDPALLPDALAREWAEARPDHSDRDLDAELLMHMLYRAFLREGPRALRRSGRPLPRDPDLLRSEFSRRKRQRQRHAAEGKKPSAPSILAVRLDAHHPAASSAPLYLPVPVSGLAAILAVPERIHGRMAACDMTMHSSARLADIPPLGGQDRTIGGIPVSPPYAIAAKTGCELVRELPADTDMSLNLLASPVFEAARNLRERLSEIAPVPDALSESLVPVPASDKGAHKKPDVLKTFGGAENHRFARAGVRITRMALTLEGKMRPGARLKVAGKLVYADADGCFRVECVLSGRKASIPMQASMSIDGEARSVINVEWEKLGSREKKNLPAK